MQEQRNLVKKKLSKKDKELLIKTYMKNVSMNSSKILPEAVWNYLDGHQDLDESFAKSVKESTFYLDDNNKPWGFWVL